MKALLLILCAPAIVARDTLFTRISQQGRCGSVSKVYTSTPPPGRTYPANCTNYYAPLRGNFTLSSTGDRSVVVTSGADLLATGQLTKGKMLGLFNRNVVVQFSGGCLDEIWNPTPLADGFGTSRRRRHPYTTATLPTRVICSTEPGYPRVKTGLWSASACSCQVVALAGSRAAVSCTVSRHECQRTGCYTKEDVCTAVYRYSEPPPPPPPSPPPPLVVANATAANLTAAANLTQAQPVTGAPVVDNDATRDSAPVDDDAISDPAVAQLRQELHSMQKELHDTGSRAGALYGAFIACLVLGVLAAATVTFRRHRSASAQLGGAFGMSRVDVHDDDADARQPVVAHSNQAALV